MEPAAVERSIWINSTPERVWNAVTDPHQLSQWYATNYAWEIPVLAVGARVTFHNGPDDALNATIDTLDRPRQFSVRWDPIQEPPHKVTLVTHFLITAENDGVRVTIRETGYEALSPDERRAWMEATGGGYSMSVENLKALVEGQPLPHTRQVSG